MSEREDQLETLELSISQAKEQLELKESLNRLRNNKDFVLLIETGYFEKEASRLVLLRASPQAKEIRDEIDESISAIGQLRQYLSRIYVFGNQAEKALIDAEQTREEILSSSVEE